MHDGKVILARYHTKQALNQAYLSFSREGGLFIPSTDDISINDHVYLVVNLPESPEVYTVRGTVCWVSHDRRPGFGVHFSRDDFSQALRRVIEAQLGAMLTAAAPTLTM